MKLFKIFYITFICVLSYVSALAAPKPPPPAGKEYVPPPPGLPIDESIMILVIIALVFGICTIYANNLKTKNPI